MMVNIKPPISQLERQAKIFFSNSQFLNPNLESQEKVVDFYFQNNCTLIYYLFINYFIHSFNHVDNFPSLKSYTH